MLPRSAPIQIINIPNLVSNATTAGFLSTIHAFLHPVPPALFDPDFKLFHRRYSLQAYRSVLIVIPHIKSNFMFIDM